MTRLWIDFTLAFPKSWFSFGLWVVNMKRALKIFGIIVLVLFLAVVSFVVYGLYLLDKPFRDARHFLLHDMDRRAVSVACLDLMTKAQYKPLMGDLNGDDPRLPPAIRDVKASWLDVDTDRVLIMKTGGFDHIGLIFQTSTTSSNAYDLVFREETPGHDILLYTLYDTNHASALQPGIL